MRAGARASRRDWAKPMTERCAPSKSTAAPEPSFSTQQRLLAVWGLDFAARQITSISSIAHPDKLAHLGPVGDFRSLLRSTR